jgi:hypothetical protein
MALQTSGTISINNLRTEFGDTGTSSLSEFYRGGGLVPATTTTSTTTYQPGPGTTNYNYSLTSPLYGWLEDEYFPFTVYIYWNNAAITTFTQNYAGEISQDTSGGWTYYRFSSPTTTGLNIGDGTTYSVYQIRRQQTTNTTTNINTNVPTSGTISLSNFYGATA